jgi:iron(III) transport system substrate-binding protein
MSRMPTDGRTHGRLGLGPWASGFGPCVLGLRALPLLALLTIALTLASCSRDDTPSVTLYVSADERFAREVVALFEKETGIDVDMVTDTEAKKTTGLVERIRAERGNPLADVFWSSEVFMTIDLASEGLLAPHESDATRDWPAPHRDDERLWHGFAARARVIVFSTDRVPSEHVPDTWMGLTQERFRGRVVMADPRFGTTGGHFAAMKAYWNRLGIPGYYEAFLEGLRDNEIRLLASGNAGVVEAVVRGEADIGMTDTDDVWVARERGAKIDIVYARHNADDGPGTGTLLIPNTVARIAGGPNPDAAARLIDFLLSERVERMLAESASHNVPLRPDFADSFPDLHVPNPLRVSFERAAALRREAVEQAMHVLTETKREVGPGRDEEAAREDDEALEKALDPGNAP